jgi:hypothetical protein
MLKNSTSPSTLMNFWMSSSLLNDWYVNAAMAGLATLASTTAAREAEFRCIILSSSSVLVAFCDCNDDKKSFCVGSSISNDASELLL